MTTVATHPSPLKRHVTATYLNLRVGVGVLGFALPWTLWIVGRILAGLPLQPSMSAYYHSPMRDVFVGVLVAVSLFLHLYKGFSSAENWALNFAGIFGVGVALFPTGAEEEVTTLTSTLHGTFAVLFFTCIAYVAIFRASDTLSLIRDAAEARWLRDVYRVLGVGMIVLPLAAVALSYLLDPGGGRSVIFFVEAAAVTVFAVYWLVKSREMKKTHAEALAAEGKLRVSTPPREGRRALGRLTQVGPPEDEVVGWGDTSPERFGVA